MRKFTLRDSQTNKKIAVEVENMGDLLVLEIGKTSICMDITNGSLSVRVWPDEDANDNEPLTEAIFPYKERTNGS